jgi:hypothetical protein
MEVSCALRVIGRIVLHLGLGAWLLFGYWANQVPRRDFSRGVWRLRFS